MTYLAQASVKDQTVTFGIKDMDRLEHMCVIGRTGNDRMAFLARMILEDVHRGIGVVLLDTTGTLSRLVMERILDDMKDRLIYLDPADGEYPYSWNPVDDYRGLAPEIAAPLLSKAIASAYQIPVSSLTEACASYMLQHESTMLTFYDLATDESIRDAALKDDDELKKSLELALAENAESIEQLHERGRYVAKDSLVRNLLGQKDSKFTMAKLEEHAIVIVDFSRIKMFPTRMTPLVRMFVHATEARAHEHADPVGLYLNDCLRYLEEGDIDLIFTKHAVMTCISDTFYNDTDRELREKTVSRAGSIVAFAPNPGDVATVERVFYPYITAEELGKVEEGEFIIALTIDAIRSRPFFARVIPLSSRSSLSEQDLMGVSRDRYTLPRLKVDQLFKSSAMIGKEMPMKDAPPGTFTDTFRSIFSKRSGDQPLAKGEQQKKQSISPSDMKTTQKSAQTEIPENDLKTMLRVDSGKAFDKE